MRRIEETDIFKLRKNGKVKSKDGKNLKPILPFAHKKTSGPEPTEIELQTKAVETLSATIATMLNSQNKSSTMLIDAVIKAKPDIKIPPFPSLPAFPKPVREWSFDVTRDKSGFIENIRAKAV